MEPMELREYELRLEEWMSRGLQVLADETEGELHVTAYYVSPSGQGGSERDEDYWPMSPAVVDLLNRNGIVISRTLAGPG